MLQLNHTYLLLEQTDDHLRLYIFFTHPENINYYQQAPKTTIFENKGLDDRLYQTLYFLVYKKLIEVEAIEPPIPESNEERNYLTKLLPQLNFPDLLLDFQKSNSMELQRNFTLLYNERTIIIPRNEIKNNYTSQLAKKINTLVGDFFKANQINLDQIDEIIANGLLFTDAWLQQAITNNFGGKTIYLDEETKAEALKQLTAAPTFEEKIKNDTGSFADAIKAELERKKNPPPPPPYPIDMQTSNSAIETAPTLPKTPVLTRVIGNSQVTPSTQQIEQPPKSAASGYITTFKNWFFKYQHYIFVIIVIIFIALLIYELQHATNW